MTLCLAYISRLTPKCRMICRLTPTSCVMYAGLRLAKTFVCCCPDQLNKRLTDSKIESVRRKLCSARAKSTFVVASSQSQRVAFMTRSARGGADRYVAGSSRIRLSSICPNRVTGETKVFASQCKLRKGHDGRRNYDAHRVDFSARIL